MVSDNGPQFASSETKTFAVSYNFEHITSSPRYQQGNDCLAERAVHADNELKKMLTTKDDVDLYLLSYRMPWCGHSPAELLMGRQLRTQVPQLQEQFIPEWSYLRNLRRQHKAYKEKQANYYMM